MEPDVWGNRATVTEFILLGLIENTRLQPILFAVFLFAYVVTVGGNASILATVSVEPKLHTPMYYFLGNLSLLDVDASLSLFLQCWHVSWPTSAEFPMLLAFHSSPFFNLMAGVNYHLLTAMAYGHYLAICQLITYSTHMSHEVQASLVGICCTISFISALTHTVAVSMLDVCSLNMVNHFYCDLPHLFQLSCSSIHLNGQLPFVGATFMGVIPIIPISVKGRKKAFSTCSSHLTMVCIFYRTGFFSYTLFG